MGGQEHQIDDQIGRIRPMIRTAVVLTLKPGALEEYKRHHDNLWPELAAAIRESGIRQITTFQHGQTLFLYSEVEDDGAWDRLWETEVHKRWAEVMAPLLEMGADGKVQGAFPPRIFNFDA
jgi:L-rhamnose mutarotase